MLTVQTNMPGMTANRIGNMQQSRVNKALNRLSSGFRINSAADDPSGLCMAQKMRAKLASLEATEESTLDMLSKAETADGVLGEMQSMMQRMNELAVKASNSTLDETDRLNIDKEYQELLKEIDRQGHTDYNGENLLPAKADVKGGSGANDFNNSEFNVSGNNINAFLDGLDTFLAQISKAEKAGDTKKLKELGVSTDLTKKDSVRLEEAVKVFTKNNAEKLLNQESGKSEALYNVSLKDGKLDIKRTSLSQDMYGLKGTSLKTKEDALATMPKIKDAIDKISGQRANQAAEISRINESLNNIAILKINLTDSLSKIVDADMAKEMMEYTKQQALVQSSGFVMAHSNEQMKDTASFLRGMLAS